MRMRAWYSELRLRSICIYRSPPAPVFQSIFKLWHSKATDYWVAHRTHELHKAHV